MDPNFMEKFSASNRPPITPQQRVPLAEASGLQSNGNLLKKMLPGLEKPQDAFDKFINTLGNTNVSNNGRSTSNAKERKGSTSKVKFVEDEGNLRNNMLGYGNLTDQMLTPASALHNLLGNRIHVHETHNVVQGGQICMDDSAGADDPAVIGARRKVAEEPGNLTFNFEQASIEDKNLSMQLGKNKSEFTQKSRHLSWNQKRKNRKSWAGAAMSSKMKTGQAQGKHEAEEKTYREFSKVDVLTPRSTYPNSVTDKMKEDASNIQEKPRAICCQWSLDKKGITANGNPVSDDKPIEKVSEANHNCDTATTNIKQTEPEIPTVCPDISSENSQKNLTDKEIVEEKVHGAEKIVNISGENKNGKSPSINVTTDIELGEENKELDDYEDTIIQNISGEIKTGIPSKNSIQYDVLESTLSNEDHVNAVESLESKPTILITLASDNNKTNITKDEELGAGKNDADSKHEDVEGGKDASTANNCVQNQIYHSTSFSTPGRVNAVDSLLVSKSEFTSTSTPDNKDNEMSGGNKETQLKPVDIESRGDACTTDNCIQPEVLQTALSTPFCLNSDQGLLPNSTPGRVKDVDILLVSKSEFLSTSTPDAEDFCYGQAKVVMEMKSTDTNFAPVDVTKGNTFLYITSQASNTVSVFKKNIFQGLLKIQKRNQFNSPHNVIYIPPYCCSSKDTQDGQSILEDDYTNNPFSRLAMSSKTAATSHVDVLSAGCLIVLDNEGFHVFSEHGVFIATLMKGLGYKYRGLATHYKEYIDQRSRHPVQVSRLYLLTVDINDPKAAYLCLMNLEKALSLTIQGLTSVDLDRIKIEPTEQRSGAMDQKIKCRFVASNTAFKGQQLFNKTFGPADNTKDEIAYVSGMMSKQIYSVNLKTKESKILKLTQRTNPLDSAAELTFAERPFRRNCHAEATFVDKTIVPEESFMTKPFTLLQPTGLQVDAKGNLLIADRHKNEVCAFSSDGLLISAIVYGKMVITEEGKRLKDQILENQELYEPVGISLDHEQRHLYVCSNKNKKVIDCQL